MAREYFNAYHSYLDSMEFLSDAERGRLFTALLLYSSTGEAPQLRGNERFVFPGIRSQIDRDIGNYDAYCARQRANGSKGGRPRKAPPRPEPDGFAANPKKPGEREGKGESKGEEKGEGEPERTSSSPPGAEEAEEAVCFWEENFGPMPRCLRQAAEGYLRRGLEGALVTWALGEAAKTGAHQPWRYAETILKDCLAQGLHTLAEYERARRGWGRNARPPEREIRPEQDLLLLAGDKLPVFRKLPGREKDGPGEGNRANPGAERAGGRTQESGADGGAGRGDENLGGVVPDRENRTEPDPGLGALG